MGVGLVLPGSGGLSSVGGTPLVGHVPAVTVESPLTVEWGAPFVPLTQAAYDALSPPVATTLYVITG